MAFDWTKVDGYREDMTADEKLELLASYEAPNPEPAPEERRGPTVSKAQFDKVMSENASLKKQMRSRMTEDEQREEDRRASEEALRQELETLRKEKTISGHKASYLALGFGDDMAAEAAQALADGDTDNVFALTRKHITALERELRAKILKETPVPPAGEEDEATRADREFDKVRIAAGLPPKYKN